MKPLRVLSLGAGVQSSTIALMMKHGEIEPCDCAIFADTGAEPKRVYQWLDWLEKQLPYPVYRVMQRNGLTRAIEAAKLGLYKRHAQPPLYTLNADGTIGTVRRQCTVDYKLSPKRRKAQELRKGRPIIEIIGFSSNEHHRCRPPDRKYIERVEWPLIDLRMDRKDCITWMHRHFYQTPPRSACVYCPYKCDTEWRLLKEGNPEDWAEAVRMDKLMRDYCHSRIAQPTFVHRSCIPLDEVDLRTEFEHGQVEMKYDCEGMCGV